MSMAQSLTVKKQTKTCAFSNNQEYEQIMNKLSFNEDFKANLKSWFQIAFQTFGSGSSEVDGYSFSPLLISILNLFLWWPWQSPGHISGKKENSLTIAFGCKSSNL